MFININNFNKEIHKIILKNTLLIIELLKILEENFSEEFLESNEIFLEVIKKNWKLPPTKIQKKTLSEKEIKKIKKEQNDELKIEKDKINKEIVCSIEEILNLFRHHAIFWEENEKFYKKNIEFMNKNYSSLNKNIEKKITQFLEDNEITDVVKIFIPIWSIINIFNILTKKSKHSFSNLKDKENFEKLANKIQSYKADFINQIISLEKYLIKKSDDGSKMYIFYPKDIEIIIKFNRLLKILKNELPRSNIKNKKKIV